MMLSSYRSTYGENGDKAFADLDPRLELFQLLRSSTRDEVRAIVARCCAAIDKADDKAGATDMDTSGASTASTASPSASSPASSPSSSGVSRDAMISDLFVLLAATRDVRGGKGEKQLFVWLFFALLGNFPAEALGFLRLLPEYGSFKDLKAVLEEAEVVLGVLLVLDDARERAGDGGGGASGERSPLLSKARRVLREAEALSEELALKARRVREAEERLVVRACRLQCLRIFAEALLKDSEVPEVPEVPEAGVVAEAEEKEAAAGAEAAGAGEDGGAKVDAADPAAAADPTAADPEPVCGLSLAAKWAPCKGRKYNRGASTTARRGRWRCSCSLRRRGSWPRAGRRRGERRTVPLRRTGSSSRGATAAWTRSR